MYSQVSNNCPFRNRERYKINAARADLPESTATADRIPTRSKQGPSMLLDKSNESPMVAQSRQSGKPGDGMATPLATVKMSEPAARRTTCTICYTVSYMENLAYSSARDPVDA
jgi:hypothetical protein